MAKTKTSSKVKDRYNAKAYDEIKIRVAKGRKAELQAFVERHGQSVNGFINRLIDEALERAKVVPVGSPAEEDRPGDGFGFSVGSPEETICSRLSSQWGPDFQTALSDSGQTEEEYITQAVMERVKREQKPTCNLPLD